MPEPSPTRTSGQTLTQMKLRRFSEPSPGRRSVRRPEDIQRDVRGLKLRQRVTAVLNDDFIRHELEDTLVKRGEVDEEYLNESIRAYQDFLVPSSGFYGGAPGLSSVFPINDIRGTDTLNYTKTERNLRCKLASAYRLVDLFGWSTDIYSHLTVRCPSERGAVTESYLINPFGLFFKEVTASNLIKIDPEGNILDNGSTNCGINRGGLHQNVVIHQARKDANCIIHIHEPNCIAVCAMKQGVLPISQEAVAMGPVSYQDLNDTDFVKNFPEGSKTLMLRNHGVICVGETVEEAMFVAYNIVRACTYQVKAMAAGIDNLILIDEEMQQQIYQRYKERRQDVKDRNLGIGIKEFEAWMRMLDTQGHRTGYVYHNPDLYNKSVPEPKTEARSPATMSSMRYEMIFGDNQTTPARRAHTRGKGNTYKNRAKWLNSPVKATEYKKEIIQDSHSEPSILKDSQPEKETAVKILEESNESKGPVIQEKITTTTPAIVMSEIPLEDLFNDDAFVEKGSNDAETKEEKPKEVITTITLTTTDDDAGTSKQVVTTTVVKDDGAPVTTVEEVVVNGDEAAVDKNLLSPPGEVDEKTDEASDEGGEKEKDEKGEGAEGGKPRQKVKKKRSFKKTLQGIVHRRSKSDKDDQDEEKS